MHDLNSLKRIALHAKHLFVHACTHAQAEEPVQRMIAVHDMHNAVEWLLDGLWSYYRGIGGKPRSMMEMFDTISREHQKLILKREIGMVNEARNQAQHHAVVPSVEGLTKYAAYCEAFFRQALCDVSPGCEYDKLSMALLLPADLDFQVESNCFPIELISWLGAKTEPVDVSGANSTPWSRISLNLQGMIMKAERYLAEFADAKEEEQWSIIRTAMTILASSFLYGQYFAVRGLRYQPSFEYDGYDADGCLVSPRNRDYALFRYITGNISSVAGCLPSLHQPLFNDDISGIFDNSVQRIALELTDHRIAIEGLASTLRRVLQAVSIGIDLKKLWHFENLYTRASNRSGEPLSHVDLLWSQDFVMQSLLDLAPLVRNVPSKDRVLVEQDTEFGVHVSLRIDSFDDSDSGLPF